MLVILAIEHGRFCKLLDDPLLTGRTWRPLLFLFEAAVR
jgi:hypothetical protein